MSLRKLKSFITLFCITYTSYSFITELTKYQLTIQKSDQNIVKLSSSYELPKADPAVINTAISSSIELPKADPAFNNNINFWEDGYTTPPIMLSKATCKPCRNNKALYDYLPKNTTNRRDIFGAKKTCAIVTHSSVLSKYQYGREIDSHDIVFRFNLVDRPNVTAYGSKSTHQMVHNSLWIPGEMNAKYNLNIIADRKETLILFDVYPIWSSIWKKPFNQVNAFNKYAIFLQKRRFKLNQTYILDHNFSLRAVEALARFTGVKANYTPSSGWMGLFLLSRVCTSIDTYGFTNTFKSEYASIHHVSHNFTNEHLAMQMWSSLNKSTVPLHMYPPI